MGVFTKAPERFDGGELPLRWQWRLAQIAAKQYDGWYPFWWKNDKLVHDFLALMTPRYRRIWVELIKQRTGE